MTKRARISVIVAFGVLIIICVALIPAFIRARSTSATLPCVNNLRQIDAAKNQWALEHHKKSQDTLTWNDLRPYFPARWTNGMPICPDGGTYTLGRVGESPRCSLGDKDNEEHWQHILP